MSDRYNSQTYYELLEITPSAGPTEIYNAYQKARSTYSPSSPALYSMFTPQEAQQLMALIEEAYQTLSHQARRREYDQKIGMPKSSSAPPAAIPQPPPQAPNQPQQAQQKRGEDTWVGSVKFTTKPDDLPEGFARTKFTVYEINREVENEIDAVEVCDGSLLQKVRLYKGVTLEQMSDEIRVIKSTLVALENNDLDALPVPVFTRGFVVQYARLLGLDERKIADAYMKYFRANKK